MTRTQVLTILNSRRQLITKGTNDPGDVAIEIMFVVEREDCLPSIKTEKELMGVFTKWLRGLR